MMHLVGVFFAPRIKDRGSQQLYGFKSKKEYAELDYKLIPDHSINTVLVEKHWGRPVGTIFLGLWYP